MKKIKLKDSERQPCEVWTRVMGFHRPVQSFNIGKKSEHRERKHFIEPSLSKGIMKAACIVGCLFLTGCVESNEKRFMDKCQLEIEECKCMNSFLTGSLSKGEYSKMLDERDRINKQDPSGNSVLGLILSGTLVNEKVSRAVFMGTMTCAGEMK